MAATPGALVLIQDAARRAGIGGEGLGPSPARAARRSRSAAKSQALSLAFGCKSNRVFTQIGADEAYAAIPAQQVGRLRRQALRSAARDADYGDLLPGARGEVRPAANRTRRFLHSVVAAPRTILTAAVTAPRRDDGDRDDNHRARGAAGRAREQHGAHTGHLRARALAVAEQLGSLGDPVQGSGFHGADAGLARRSGDGRRGKRHLSRLRKRVGRGPPVTAGACSSGANASYKQQQKNRSVTEIVELPNRGHALTIDSGWREVADTALKFVRRFIAP